MKNEKAIYGLVMVLSLIGLGTGVFFLLRKKKSEDENLNVQAVGGVGEVVSDQIPDVKIVSQEIVNNAVVTRLVDDSVLIEKEDAKPVIVKVVEKPISHISEAPKPIIREVVEPQESIVYKVDLRVPTTTYYPRIETDIIKLREPVFLEREV